MLWMSIIILPDQKEQLCRTGRAIACPNVALALPSSMRQIASGNTGTVLGSCVASHKLALSIGRGYQGIRTAPPSPDTWSTPPVVRAGTVPCTVCHGHLGQRVVIYFQTNCNC